jgi:hypothetical protein
MVGAIEAVLSALNAARVRYLVVGGVAVVLHGHLRATADLDLIVQLSHENALDAVRALEGLGFQPIAPVPAAMFADAAARRSWIDDKGMTVFGLWSDRFPGLEVDLFASEPLDFEAAYTRALRVQLSSTFASVVCLEDLVALEKAAGRPADFTDIVAGPRGGRRMNTDGAAKSFADHRKAQLRRNLRLSYAERLNWLEETMEAFRQWKGLARTAARRHSRPI